MEEAQRWERAAADDRAAISNDHATNPARGGSENGGLGRHRCVTDVLADDMDEYTRLTPGRSCLMLLG